MNAYSLGQIIPMIVIEDDTPVPMITRSQFDWGGGWFLCEDARLHFSAWDATPEALEWMADIRFKYGEV